MQEVGGEFNGLGEKKRESSEVMIVNILNQEKGRMDCLGTRVKELHIAGEG